VSADLSQLKCRACKLSFAASKMALGGWHVATGKKPPSCTCSTHSGTALCRWEVRKFRQQLWNKMEPAFHDRPVVFLTMVPPRRLVAFDQLGIINLENEKRAMRRVLRNALPKGTLLVSIFDISLTDDQSGDHRVRYWVPHFHVLIAGKTAAEIKKVCRSLYTATAEVPRPIHIRDAPTPKNALNYSMKHIDDVYADTIFRKSTGSGDRASRRRWLQREERTYLSEFVQRNSFSTFVYFKGFRCPDRWQ
jgi:hypothetical protein